MTAQHVFLQPTAIAALLVDMAPLNFGPVAAAKYFNRAMVRSPQCCAITDEESVRAASDCVDEFSRQHATDEVLHFECVYRSHDFADTRMVLRVNGKRRDYALKIDTRLARVRPVAERVQPSDPVSAIF